MRHIPGGGKMTKSEFTKLKNSIEYYVTDNGNYPVKEFVDSLSPARIENLTHGLPKLTTLKKIADALDSTLVIKLQAKKAG